MKINCPICEGCVIFEKDQVNLECECPHCQNQIVLDPQMATPDFPPNMLCKSKHRIWAAIGVGLGINASMAFAIFLGWFAWEYFLRHLKAEVASQTVVAIAAAAITLLAFAVIVMWVLFPMTTYLQLRAIRQSLWEINTTLKSTGGLRPK